MNEVPVPKATVVVGVVRDQPEEVLLQAATFATQFGAELVCANVDMTRYTVEELPDGSISAAPIDPDVTGAVREEFDPELAAWIAELLTPRSINWKLRALAGEPAHELARIADELGSVLIVVGTRHEGFRGGVREFFTGSVAVHLAHRQHRPVVVVPLTPSPHGAKLPWEQL